jgi:hypothetical protein
MPQMNKLFLEQKKSDEKMDDEIKKIKQNNKF